MARERERETRPQLQLIVSSKIYGRPADFTSPRACIHKNNSSCPQSNLPRKVFACNMLSELQSARLSASGTQRSRAPVDVIAAELVAYKERGKIELDTPREPKKYSLGQKRTIDMLMASSAQKTQSPPRRVHRMVHPLCKPADTEKLMSGTCRRSRCFVSGAQRECNASVTAANSLLRRARSRTANFSASTDFLRRVRKRAKTRAEQRLQRVLSGCAPERSAISAVRLTITTSRNPSIRLMQLLRYRCRKSCVVVCHSHRAYA